MQDDINHYVTRNRINNASFRQKLDPIAKSISRRQNTIVGLLLREVDVGKKGIASELIKKGPRPPGIDYTIQNWLNKLKNNNENFNKNNGDDNNSALSLNF